MLIKVFPNIVPFMRKFGKYGRARQAKDAYNTWRMCFACWKTKATDTHSEYVILTAVARQQWLRERCFALQVRYLSRDVQLVVFIYLNTFIPVLNVCIITVLFYY